LPLLSQQLLLLSLQLHLGLLELPLIQMVGLVHSREHNVVLIERFFWKAPVG
jgi:hypothetical protein